MDRRLQRPVHVNINRILCPFSTLYGFSFSVITLLKFGMADITYADISMHSASLEKS